MINKSIKQNNQLTNYLIDQNNYYESTLNNKSIKQKNQFYNYMLDKQQNVLCHNFTNIKNISNDFIDVKINIK